MIFVVTGACGFIGSTILDALKKEKDLVIGIDKTDECKCESLDEYYKCDITIQEDIDNLVKQIPKCDVIVHAAAVISFDNFNSDMVDVNCNGTLQMGRFGLATGARQIVYISSIPIIGRPHVLPITEDNHCANPSTLYHLTKFMGETYLNLPQFKDIIVSILRLPAPISPQMPANRILPVYLNKAVCGQPITIHGKGNRIQNYVDTRDVASAVVCAINKNKPGLFLISGQSISNNELAKMCNEICNSTAGIKYTGRKDPEESYRWIISSDKSFNDLGYKPQYKVKDTLLEMKKIMEIRKSE